MSTGTRQPIRAGRGFLIGLLGLTVVAVPAPVEAGGPGTDIVVTTFDDELNLDGECSLREAVISANSDAPVDACVAGDGHDVIRLPSGIHQLSIPGAGEDLGLTGDLDVTESLGVSVVGVGAGGWATIDGGGLDRIFDVHPAARLWSFAWLVLRNGDAGAEAGGAIRVGDGTCDENGFPENFSSLIPVLVEGNRAARGGGLDFGSCRLSSIRFASIVDNHATGEGGAISARAGTALSVETSTISGNSAGVAGGGLWVDPDSEPTLGFSAITLEYATVAENTAPEGGGIWSSASVQVESSIVAMNEGGNCAGGTSAGGMSDDDTCVGAHVDSAGLLPLTRVGNAVVHPLADDSPAIELAGGPRASNGWCSSMSSGDQLGTPRPLDGDGDGTAHCDMGAIEHAAIPLQPANPGPPHPDPTPALPDTAMHGAARPSCP